MAQRRAALLLRVGMTEEDARRADGGRILSAMVAAGAHRVNAAEATRRTPEGTPKTLEWLAREVPLLSGRRATTRDARRWLAANMPEVLTARLAAWEERTRYLPAEHQPPRWADPDARVVRWERRREYGEARP